LLHGGREGFLPRLFSRIEIAEQADQCCENTTRLSAKDFLECPIGNAHVHGGLLAFMADCLRSWPTGCVHARRARARPHLSLRRPDGPHFDAAVFGAGDPRCNGNGLVQVLRLDQVVAPNCSRVSANGPSVAAIWPLRTLTVVAEEVGLSRSPALNWPALMIPLVKSVYSAVIDAMADAVLPAISASLA